MNARQRLARFLRTDPRDVGCDEAMAVLHVYVELAERDAEAARRQFLGVATHLAACGPCEQDFQGLLLAATTAW